jgi:predicted peptidase
VRHILLLYFSFLLISLAVPSRSTAGTRETGFLDRTLSVYGTTYKYQVFLPKDWTPKRKWPIVLFLHGYGERGSDGLLQTDVGLPDAIRLDRSRFPAIVVAPQCRTDSWWTQTKMEEMALAALAATTKEFRGDPKRTYLTGLSMGGYATWDLASRYSGKFAAVVPICGGIVLPMGFLKGFPDLAKDAYRDALKAAGGNVKYKEYPGVGHNSWDKAYAEPELMPWLLSKSL